MAAGPGGAQLELGLQVSLSHQAARAGASRVDAAVRALPWLRIVGGSQEPTGTVVHLAATLGSPEAIKSGEPEVQVVVGGLADLLADLADWEPSFGPIPEPQAVVACTTATQLVCGWAA